MMKPRFKLAAICALFALTACRTAHVGPSDGGGTLSAEVQYCASSGNAGDETVEAYGLVADPGETNNLVRAGASLPKEAQDLIPHLKPNEK